jgi:hypothetical protein
MTLEKKVLREDLHRTAGVGSNYYLRIEMKSCVLFRGNLTFEMFVVDLAI